MGFFCNLDKAYVKNVEGLHVKCILRIDEFRKYKMLKDCMYNVP